MGHRPAERTRLRRDLLSRSYEVTAHRSSWRRTHHLGNRSTDHFEGIRASPIQSQTRSRMAHKISSQSHSGWSPVSIGPHLGYCTATIRRVLHQFQSEGIEAIRHRPRGPAPDTERRIRIQSELGQLMSRERTWSSRQLSAALLDRGVTLSPRSVRRHLRQMNARYIRSCRTLKHKQDAVKVEQSRNSLDNLKKSLPKGS